MMEGISSEAFSLAGTLGLSKLIVLYDSNKISIEGGTDIAFTEDVRKRFEAFGFITHLERPRIMTTAITLVDIFFISLVNTLNILFIKNILLYFLLILLFGFFVLFLVFSFLFVLLLFLFVLVLLSAFLFLLIFIVPA